MLEQNGIGKLDTSDPDSIDVAAIEELAQDYRPLQTAGGHRPQVAEVGTARPAAINPVQAALQAVPDLVSWREKDQDRFDFAIIVDEKLRLIPRGKGKSLDERFAEAARRKQAAFGDEVILRQGYPQGCEKARRFHPVQPFGTQPRPIMPLPLEWSALVPCLRPSLSARWAP